MAFNAGGVSPNGQNTQAMPFSPASAQLPASHQVPIAGDANTVGELPDWLTGILSDADKSSIGNKSGNKSSTQSQQSTQPKQPLIDEQPTTEQRIVPAADGEAISASET